MEVSKINEIMNEISYFCEHECGNLMYCLEEECVLFRIEQILCSM